MQSVIVRFVCAFIVLVTGSRLCPAADSVSPDWVGKWREDLTLLAEKFPETHADAFHARSREEFEADLDRLSAEVPSMAHHEVAVELLALVASLGDGHTRLSLPLDPASDFTIEQGHTGTDPPNDPDLLFRIYPLRLALFSDGLFVQRIGAVHRAAAGGRVLRIGRLSAEEAIEAVSPVIRRDNAMQVKDLLPMHLVIPEVLHARQVIDEMDRASFVVETRDGEQITFELEPVPHGGEVEWIDARDPQTPLPLYLRHPERPFWITWLEEPRTVYLQLNAVLDGEEETLAQFAQRVDAFLAEHPAEQLVIDLRRNWGGSYELARPLLHNLMCHKEVNQLGRLYTLIGRTTFSAAQMLAVDLERHTKTLFVGEPTGSSPNHFGDSRKIVLPNTGLTVRASTLYWQFSDPRDQRPWIPPHIPVELTFEDYLNGRDPVLAAVLEAATGKGTKAELAGTWTGVMTPPLQFFDIEFAFHTTESGWQGTIDLPALGVEQVPLEQLQIGGPDVTFEVPLRVGSPSFRGWLQGDRILGEITLGPARFPFVVQRGAE